MRCPRDYSLLKYVIKQQGAGYSCQECDGIFYENKHVESFKYNFQTDILEKIFQAGDKLIQSELICPRCSIAMFIAKFKDFEIDFCNNCHGIWFDRNEVIKVIECYGKYPSSGESDILTFLASWLG